MMTLLKSDEFLKSFVKHLARPRILLLQERFRPYLTIIGGVANEAKLPFFIFWPVVHLLEITLDD
jgi:hypothetical protein